MTFADTGGAVFLLCGAKAVLTSKKDSVCKAFPAFDAPGKGDGTHPDCPQRFLPRFEGTNAPDRRLPVLPRRGGAAWGRGDRSLHKPEKCCFHEREI